MKMGLKHHLLKVSDYDTVVSENEHLEDCECSTDGGGRVCFFACHMFLLLGWGIACNVCHCR